jgi:hypothetical protein
MSQELPTLTRDNLTVSSSIQDEHLTKIRGLGQTNSNCNSTLGGSTWNTTLGLDLSHGGNISGSMTTGTLPNSGYTYATTHTTLPYTIGTALGNGPITQPNVSIANTQFENNGKIIMKGEKADIEINGKSMSAWMEKVEQRLNILQPNPDMEKDWDELRRLGERYRKLEKKCQEKSRMWETLKKMPPPKL